MRRLGYTLLCKDEANQLSYFYDFADDYVYCVDVRESTQKGAAAGGIGGFLGGIAGVFLYPVIGKFSCGLPSAALICMSIIMGVIAAILVGGWGIRRTRRLYFTAERRMEVTGEEITKLYSFGKSFRRKYIGLEIFLFFFAVVAAILAGASHNLFWFLCAVCMWGVWGILLLARRPFSTWKLRQK